RHRVRRPSRTLTGRGMGHGAGGSAGRAAAGALRIGRAVGAALTNRRLLGAAEARGMAVAGGAPLALAVGAALGPPPAPPPPRPRLSPRRGPRVARHRALHTRTPPLAEGPRRPRQVRRQRLLTRVTPGIGIRADSRPGSGRIVAAPDDAIAFISSNLGLSYRSAFPLLSLCDARRPPKAPTRSRFFGGEMKFLRKTLAATTLTWLAVAFSCAILNASGGAMQSVATGIGLALPAWPLLFAVLVPMMAAGEFISDAQTPVPVSAVARRSSQK